MRCISYINDNKSYLLHHLFPMQNNIKIEAHTVVLILDREQEFC